MSEFMARDEEITDTMPKCEATELELDTPPAVARTVLNRTLRVFEMASSRPRKAGCWAYVQCELWNARQDALRSGAIVRGSEEHKFVSARYNEATRKLEVARAMERAGHADARV